MEISEMFNRVLVESGQFLLEINGVELDKDRFLTLVKSVLGKYNKYHPIDDKFNLNMLSTRVYTFTDSSQNYGIPQWIVSVTPVQMGTDSAFNTNRISSVGSLLSYLGSSNSNPYLMEKCTFPFEYRDGKLYIPTEDQVDVHAVYLHKIREEESNGDTLYHVDTITDEDETFFNLLRAKFMISLGRSRRAFTMQDLPIATDASEIVAEGKELEREVTEDLYENDGKQYLSYGG